MNFLDEIAEDCKIAETDLGSATVTYNEVEYPAAATLIRRGTTVIIGGREVDIKLTLRVRNKGENEDGAYNFGQTPPKSGDKVTFQAVTYRIATVNHAHGAFMEWDLIDAAR